jgi:hypothetical protein
VYPLLQELLEELKTEEIDLESQKERYRARVD